LIRPNPAPGPRRILVIVTRRIGDALLTTPLLGSLRRAWPAAAIHVLTYPGSSGVLAGNPDIDAVVEVPERPGLGDYILLLRRILRRYDLALATLTSDRPHAYAFLASARRVSVVPADGPGRTWKRRFSDAWVELDDSSTHTVEQYLRLADCLDIPRYCRVVAPAEAGADRRLAALLPFPVSETPFAVLHPSPQFPYKRWHASGWRGLIRELGERGLAVVITGGPGAAEAAYLAALLDGPRTPVVDLAGGLSLALTAELLRRARLFVGPDTAVTHMAAACGIPTVALYGPTNPVKWGPFPAGYEDRTPPFQARGPLQVVGNVALLQGTQDCVPCHEEGCERRLDSYSRCLDELPLARVLEAVERLLGGGGRPQPL
jgi:heptosyltransferase-3